MSVGAKIRTLRKRKNLTLKALGSKVGLSEQAIGQYERGERKPSIEILASIAAALEVELSDILDIKILNSNHEKYSELTGDIMSLFSYKDYEEQIFNIFNELHSCILLALIPLSGNTKEIKDKSINLLEDSMFYLKDLLELEMLLSPQKYPDDYLEDSRKIMSSLYNSLEKLRLTRFSIKDRD